MPDPKHDHLIESRYLGDHWMEIRLRAIAPTPEHMRIGGRVEGTAARVEIARLFISGTIGIADMLGMPELSAQLDQLWERARATLAR